MKYTVGRFELDDGILTAPAEFMEEQGNELLDKILAGEDAVFNMTCDQSPSVELAVLVRLQTAYAGWLGAKQLLATVLDDRRPSRPE